MKARKQNSTFCKTRLSTTPTVGFAAPTAVRDKVPVKKKAQAKAKRKLRLYGYEAPVSLRHHVYMLVYAHANI